MKKITLLSLLVFFFSVSIVCAGPKIEFGEDGYLKPLLLGQFHYSFLDGAQNEDDFYLRRGRIIMIGQLQDGVKFFMDTDNDKAGKTGTTVSTDIQDIFVDVRLGDSAQWVKVGLILLPFSFETCSSSVSLLGLDFNAEVIKLTNTFAWRNYGAELHGSFADNIAYRMSFSDGYDNSLKNDDSAIRVTGHLDINILGKVSKGWFYGQNALNNEQYLNVGVGFDSQGDATSINTVDPVTGITSSSVEDSDAFVVDLQSCFPFSDNNAVIFNGAYYDWDSTIFKGNTAFAELGLLFNKIMITGKWSTIDSDTADTVDNYTVGLHYFMDKKHNLQGGIEYRSGDSADWTLVGFQVLL